MTTPHARIPTRRWPRVVVIALLALIGSGAAVWVMRPRASAAARRAADPPASARTFAVSSLGGGFVVQGVVRGFWVQHPDTLKVTVRGGMLTLRRQHFPEELEIRHMRANVAYHHADGRWGFAARSDPHPIAVTMRTGEQLVLEPMTFLIERRRRNAQARHTVVFEVELYSRGREQASWVYIRDASQLGL